MTIYININKRIQMNSQQLLEKLLQITIWLPINNYPNYEVSICGTVRNVNTKRVLRPRIVGIDGNGYYAVNLCKNGNSNQYKVHRLVAIHFIPNINNAKYVDHIDNNSFNNTVSNLRWCTQQQNNFNRSLSNRNTSGFKGISLYKNLNKWEVKITINYKKIHLGYFVNLEDAKLARQKKAKELFCDFLNECEK